MVSMSEAKFCKQLIHVGEVGASHGGFLMVVISGETVNHIMKHRMNANHEK